ncbi:MAG: hypothetical protein GWP59_02170 [Chlamydiales bacterium]|nr:hypothetical protein [Chlamydiales bacterium]NCF70486.1 hypothetical protein [Chlamydiales bacterium]
MRKEINLPEVKPLADLNGQAGDNEHYSLLVKYIMSKLLPKNFVFEKADSFRKFQAQKKRFHALLPLFTHSELGQVPFSLSFFLLTKHRLNAGKYFYELLSRWLVPGKFFNVDAFCGVDFLLPQLGDDVYTAALISLRVEKDQDLYAIEKNLKMVEKEVQLGVTSPYHASRILEVKGFSSDEKTALIQENIVTLLKRRPDEFNYDTLTNMQHFLVTCGQDFKDIRDYRHMSRIIYVQYLLKRSLMLALESFPDKRHVFTKLFNATLNFKNRKKKKVLGILVCINLIRDNEIFEERHLLKGVSTFFPDVKIVEGSYLSNVSKSPPLVTVYAEFEKTSGEYFSLDEIRELKEKLAVELKGRVEHLMHPVFMPRNEEEIMRHIVTLSDQLCFTRDLPQVMICFDKQSDEDINFTIIMLRVVKNDTPSMEELFKEADSSMEFIEDRVRTVGYLRKKYPKEAHVFAVKLEKHSFLREDNSIDLYKARQVIAHELKNIIGEFRDYNGGMISKESEAFESLQSLLTNTKQYQDILLENFFYSIEPNVLRSVLEPTALRILFLMFLEALDDSLAESVPYLIRTNLDTDFAYVIIVLEDAEDRERIMSALKTLEIPAVHLAHSFVSVKERNILAFVYRCYDKEKKEKFISLIQSSIQEANLTLPGTF